MKKPGSQQLLEQLMGRATPLSKAELTSIVDTVQKHDAAIVDWCMVGIPDIDGACGRFRVKDRNAVAKLVAEMLAYDRIIDLDVFPEGQPRPDVWRVGMRVGSARHR